MRLPIQIVSSRDPLLQNRQVQNAGCRLEYCRWSGNLQVNRKVKRQRSKLKGLQVSSRSEERSIFVGNRS